MTEKELQIIREAIILLRQGDMTVGQMQRLKKELHMTNKEASNFFFFDYVKTDRKEA